jgi:sugar (pentulose or hexulose) kinase
MDLGTSSAKAVVIHLDGTVIGQATGDHAASNTLLYDPTTDAWDTKVIDALGLDAAKLPRRSAPTVETS